MNTKSDTFNGARFLALGKKYFSDNRNWYVKSLSGLFMVILLVYFGVTVNFFKSGNLPELMILITVGWVIFGTVKVMAPFVQRKSRILNTLTPASTLEKYLLAWSVSLLGGVLAPVVFFGMVNIAMYYLADISVTLHTLLDTSEPTLYDIWRLGSDLLLIITVFHGAILFAMASSGSFGQSFWRQALGAVIVILVFILIWLLPEWVGMKGSETELPIYLNMLVTERNDGAEMTQVVSWAPSTLNSILQTTILASVPIVFWVTGYYKLKEQQPK